MVQIRVGDEVTITPGHYDRVGNVAYQRLRVQEGTALRVTRVYGSAVLCRGPIAYGNLASIHVPHEYILSVNGVDPNTGQPPVVPRKLGVKPEDTGDLPYNHIGIDDPGIQWLFADMAKFADGKNWCRQYDELCEALGIPGRDQEWEVEAERNGITLFASIVAPSEDRARSMLEELLTPAT